MNKEKYLAMLMEQIKEQGLETTEEINDFLKTMQGQSLDDLPERTDKKGRSQDLVFQAYEMPVTKGRKLVKQALELDPNNADAYNYLASKEKNIDKAINLFEKAIIAGEKTLGKKFLKEEKGHFWGIIETRPYMRAKANLAECLSAKKQVNKAIEIYEEMLELNPNDNQGVRYSLSTVLVGQKDLSKYETFISKTEDEDCAIWNYNNALYHFKKSGQTTKSNKELLKAYKSNQFVINYILGITEMPEEMPMYIGRGDENEAISYVYDVYNIWKQTVGALDWLYEFNKNRLEIN